MSPSSLNTDPSTETVAHVVDYDVVAGDNPECIDDCPGCAAAGHPLDDMTPQTCPAGKHPDWAVDSEDSHTCPWCEVDQLKARVAELEQRAKDAEGRLWSAAMTRVWTNEDGKKFVFVEDIAPVLLGKADLPEPTTEWGVRYLDGRGDPALTFEARSEAERQLAGARHAGYEAELVTRTTTYGDWTTVPEGGAR